MSRLMSVAQQLVSRFSERGDVYSAWLTGDIMAISPLDRQFASVPEGKKLVAIAPVEVRFELPLPPGETAPEEIGTDIYGFSILALTRFTPKDIIYYLAAKADLLEWCQGIISGWAWQVANKEIIQPDDCNVALVKIREAQIPLDSPLTEQGWISAELSVEVVVNYQLKEV